MFSFRREEWVLFSQSTAHQSVFKVFNTLNEYFIFLYLYFYDFSENQKEYSAEQIQHLVPKVKVVFWFVIYFYN